MSTDRGQSETVGAILMVALAVVSVSIVAGALFAANSPTTHPSARIDATASDSTVSIEHRAGESLHEEEFEVVFRSADVTVPGVEWTPVTDGNRSDADASFEPGETWEASVDQPVPENETVVLVFVGGERVVLDETTVDS
ncbi:MAG: type IV pilin [Halanaeroarchaeum sp.]